MNVLASEIQIQIQTRIVRSILRPEPDKFHKFLTSSKWLYSSNFKIE